jgi:glycosyltransferase involved in cell wall biosynthesis
MKDASFMIVPSECYETGPRVVIEALACGVPVVASRMGPIVQVIKDGETGIFFEPGNIADLTEKINYAIDHPEELRTMKHNARRTYLEQFTIDKNYQLLMNIYSEALGGKI